MPRVDRVPHSVGFLTPNSSDDALSVVIPKFITVLSKHPFTGALVSECLFVRPLETARNPFFRPKIDEMLLKSNLHLAYPPFDLH